MTPTLFTVCSAAVAVIGILIAILSLNDRTRLGRSLAGMGIACAAVDLFYLGSVLSEDYFHVSLFSSLHFCSIDIVLLFLVMFSSVYTSSSKDRVWKMICRGISIYALFDMTLLMINPFHEFAVHFVPVSNPNMVCYTYEKYWAMNMHLGFAYTILVLSFVLLANKMFHVPRNYRRQYWYALVCIIATTLLNGFFLYLPVLTGIYLDYSVWGYCFCLILLYWMCFEYRHHGMLRAFKDTIYDSVDLGVVLFDFEQKLIMRNEKAFRMFPYIDFEHVTLGEFVKATKLFNEDDIPAIACSVQCYGNPVTLSNPMRCDFRPLTDSLNRPVLWMLTFTDMVTETDLLTGFYTWDHFERSVSNGAFREERNIACAVFNMNALSRLNNAEGMNAGNRALVALAQKMREVFPEDTYFMRGKVSSLVAFCYGKTENEIRPYADKVCREFRNGKEDQPGNNVIHGLADHRLGNGSILDAVKNASEAMRIRKLLDSHSTRSNQIVSLIRALQQCDRETEDHVRRTLQLGALLSERMQLPDLQRNTLSLLCLLHDIGKIGVPLEILNKPGKLTEEEFAALRTHVEKGYQITNSTPELTCIADMVRAHHERWDGHGYPDGIAGEKIPMLSRIISVVDAYDAMVSDRVYSPAMSSDQAVYELARCAGTQFDPEIVREFTLMVQENGKLLKEPPKRETRRRIEIPADEAGTAIESPNIHAVVFGKYILDERQRIIYADDTFTKITGYSEQECREREFTQTDLIFPEDRAQYLFKVSEYGAKSPVIYLEHRLRTKEGDPVNVFCMGRSYFDSAAHAQRSEILITDISARLKPYDASLWNTSTKE